jgi:hypothetical protein
LSFGADEEDEEVDPKAFKKKAIVRPDRVFPLLFFALAPMAVLIALQSLRILNSQTCS